MRSLCFLGDLVDKKDNHPSELVNGIAKEMTSFDPELDIFCIPGNHEWSKEGHEFFRFLRMRPNIRYFTEPSESGVVGNGTVSVLFLPFTREPAKAWKALGCVGEFHDYVFMHQTIKGAISSNGQKMEGEGLPDLKDWPKIYSGDIHVPQKIGPIEYVGSPFHVHFGDDFIPRCVLIEKGGNAVDLHFKSPRRIAIKVPGLDGLRQRLRKTDVGDQVKITIELAAAEKHEWPRIKRESLLCAKQAEVELHGLALHVERSDRRIGEEVPRIAARNPEAALLHFIEREGLTPSAYEAAMEVIDGKG